MRNLCAALGVSVLFALQLCAQQKSSGTGDETTNATASAEKSAAPSKNAEVSKPAAASGLFALPATPRPKPFPGPAAASDKRAPGQLVPRFEIAAMYHYLNFGTGSPFSNFDGHGGSGSITYNASRWIGLTGESSIILFPLLSFWPAACAGTVRSRAPPCRMLLPWQRVAAWIWF